MSRRCAAGINRLVIPPELDGMDAGDAGGIDVVERIAAVDGSTAGAQSSVPAATSSPATSPRGADGCSPIPINGSATMFAPAGTLTTRTTALS